MLIGLPRMLLSSLSPKEQEALMTENTTYMPSMANGALFDSSESDVSEPQRIQVSCINEEEELFLPPRPFSFARKEHGSSRWGSKRKAPDDCPDSNDLVEHAVRSVRRIGYALILVSVLLLIIDGVLRHVFGI